MEGGKRVPLTNIIFLQSLKKLLNESLGKKIQISLEQFLKLIFIRIVKDNMLATSFAEQ
jgi:hypothetical protein